MSVTGAGFIYSRGIYDNYHGQEGDRVSVKSDGSVGRFESASVQAAKTNIATINTVDWIYNLTPKTFNYRKRAVDENGIYSKNYDAEDFTDEYDTRTSFGLIAEEVAQHNTDICKYYEKRTVENPSCLRHTGDRTPGSACTCTYETKLKGVDYDALIPLLLKAIKDLKDRIDTLESA